MQRIRKYLKWGCGSLTVLFLLLAGISAISNLWLPQPPADTSVITPLDKDRLAEVFNLQDRLGEAVWPGFRQVDIPVILWNDDYSFLVGFESPPPGWEAVPGETFSGQPYFRQASQDPQNFAVEVDDQWVASLGTKTSTDLFLIQVFKDMLPPVIEQIFPYRLLIQPSEVQICGMLHESFHVFQAVTSPERLEAAERIHRLGDDYTAARAHLDPAWKAEIDLLIQAVEAAGESESRALTTQFLQQRTDRRTAANLDPDLVNYERQLEWEEGLAKYVELAFWKTASNTPGYIPVAGLADDPDFKEYATFDQRWSQTITELRLQADDEGETRFYNTGLLQAFLLDRLLTGWKDRALLPGVWLEELLEEAVK